MTSLKSAAVVALLFVVGVASRSPFYPPSQSIFVNPFDSAANSAFSNLSNESWLFDPEWLIVENDDEYESDFEGCSAISPNTPCLSSELYNPSWRLVEEF